MKRIINDLKNIYNLKQAYIHRDGETSISTFSHEKTGMISSSIELIEQYFMAAKDIETSYNEIIFPLENGDNLIAFLIDETTIAILLTKEKINLPMLHIALTLISKKLKQVNNDKKPLPTTQPLPQEKIIPEITQQPTPIKKTTAPPLKSLLSNPFSAKKSKSKDRLYANTNTQSTNAKKLVYRE